MDRLIAKYLDGDLAPEAAEQLLDALARDPELEAELRDYERMLAAAADATLEVPPEGFVDRAMARVRLAGDGEAPARARRSRWTAPLALAASLVLCFILGFSVARRGDSPVATGTDRLASAPAAADLAAFADEGLRFVRLVYTPADGAPGRVAVAGTFNDWDPARTPMQKRGDGWAALLLLPPETHEYVFVIDGERWVPDPLAPRTRDDGFGNANSVLELSL